MLIRCIIQRYNKIAPSKRVVVALLIVLMISLNLHPTFAQQNIRQDLLLNDNWRSVANNTNQNAYQGFEKPEFKDNAWTLVSVPHNWDTYEGYRRLKHGNRHGYAWYRRVFSVTQADKNKRYFLWFEGVGSYATVWLNGVQVGYHAGGRTTFTLDITGQLKIGKPNLLCVRADHPAFIKDLPWVCGGCSDDPGFSEGSQPMGIFRPVHLIVTDPVRIEPFGVHIWNDTTVSAKSATLDLETEVKNYTGKAAAITIINKLLDANGKLVVQKQTAVNLAPGATLVIPQVFSDVKNVHLWSPADPYLYSVVSQIIKNGVVTDQTVTPYGIRWISWPIGRNNGDNRFYVNGKPVFINGIAEYEHLMGNSQAFSNQEIKARVMQVQAAGFNAFRDAHQPHNLEYQKYWDKLGILWWPQYSAHIWYDSPAFRENFKMLLRDWIKERRNSPSVILWGLQNESRLPEDFAKECTGIIRSLDPTASSQRKIVTCNGGKGTDWDVPQNWTGTYGGDPLTYNQDLKKEILVGEYGAWRSLGLHTEGPFVQNATLSEDRMSQLMEMKVRLAESVKNDVAGQFHWLLYSHENPGRVQGGEGVRELDRVGPINYKGLFTSWGQPLDAFYMFRANYADKVKSPMVYIVSHTWPNRWLNPGKKDSINVYSNCDEVELFNDVKTVSLGKKSRTGVGTHFQWNNADINYNVLCAVGYVNGKPVANDVIVLNNLPAAPHLNLLKAGNDQLLKPAPGYNYLYRVNCGGPDYTDKQGNLWLADVHQNGKNTWGSVSWTDDYPGMPAFFASQQRTFDPTKGTNDGELFQTFRYGMDKLKYDFPLPDGDYQVDLFFNEPWYGTGGGMDCTGWRLFNVAVNDQTVLKNLDIWKEVGYNHALKKTVNVHITGGHLKINFPRVEAGEAIIAAIAISTKNQALTPAKSSSHLITNVKFTDPDAGRCIAQTWLDLSSLIYTDATVQINQLPSILYGAEWIKMPSKNAKPADVRFTITEASDVYVAVNANAANQPAWLKDYAATGTTIQTNEAGGITTSVFKKRFNAQSVVELSGYSSAQKYFIAVLPVTSLEPATDLKPIISYKAAGALIKGDGAMADTLGGKKVLRFTKPVGGSIIFELTPGVGDLYVLRIKYYNTGTRVLKAQMQLLAADGTVMKNEALEFKPVQKNKSGTLATTTGTSINAGNYRLVITATDAEGLIISGLEMQ